MPISAAKVLRKFGRLHLKYQGNDRSIKFVKFNNITTGFYKQQNDLGNIETEIDPPAIVLDQPDKDIQANFGGGIEQDQRIFKVVADSFVEQVPDGMTEDEGIASLSDRCEQFLYERTGQTKGGIIYGSQIYTIERFFAKPVIGGVQARYIILARAWKRAPIEQ